MNDYSENFIHRLGYVDGFVFKSGSPTIGIRNVKVYSVTEMTPVIEKGPGFFAKKILAKYTGYPMEEDDRLRN
ncbi:hypothetical protein [Methanolobus halotolerans]|uniref:hypothetical protein n=1 Tax=Methanolobus halotolerans TaxID=2052935 RepID=UPI0022A68BCC|nr:hypothetical protein [Methanolobus halotolerans]